LHKKEIPVRLLVGIFEFSGMLTGGPAWGLEMNYQGRLFV